MQEFKAGKTAVDTRTDVFVASKYPQFARSALKGLFDGQNVKINGKVAKPGYKLRQGDRITVDSGILSTEPEPIDLPVVYENSDVVVIDKPAGVLTHSKGALNLEPTVASFMQGKLNDEKLGGNRAGIVHRLDRATSGVIVCARNQNSLKWLQTQFSKRKVEKTYLAVVEGIPQPNEALIDIPIDRNPKKPQTFKAISTGRSAQTRYKLISSAKKNGKEFSLLEVQPLTGRTHQIRVHLSYIGHPVVSDAVYGHNAGPMLLHALKIELVLPNGRKKTFVAEVPQTFNDFLKNE